MIVGCATCYYFHVEISKILKEVAQKNTNDQAKVQLNCSEEEQLEKKKIYKNLVKIIFNQN